MGASGGTSLHVVSLLQPDAEAAAERALNATHAQTSEGSQFRLIISVEVEHRSKGCALPEALVRRSVKIAVEPPGSLRGAMLRAWRTAAFFGLCHVHSIALARRRYCALVPAAVWWSDLRRNAGAAAFGSHFGNVWDKRLHVALLEAYVHEALPDGQQVSRRLEFLELPSRDAYTRHIEASPSDDIPSDLGLLPRAQSALEESRADELLRFGAAVMSTSRVGLGPFGRSGRRSCSGTAAAETVEAVRLVLDKVVLMQECDRMEALVTEVQATTKLAIRSRTGSEFVHASLARLDESMRGAPVDEGADTLVGALQRGLEWAAQGVPPTVTWLGGLFRPQAFVFALLAETSRRTGTPLESLSAVAEVTGYDSAEQVGAPPENGVYVHGAALEGANWDASAGKLAEAPSGGRCATRLPVMHIRALEAVTTADTIAAAPYGVYASPVYATGPASGAERRGEELPLTAWLPSEDAGLLPDLPLGR
ncbi:hypothetical protein EMIHUDRAFT_198139 [Emiliania huxleyi CCMP1516]|uniref:Dynein heavy chain C-terminal domain-containing protein n=2 Tax=Emiliania huxleyi TaxID=2903 RepID=A0A0D3IEB7_EMIH1|nr:hypothetical protein EMIHUDRAFT_198139 [Emiliania huxleyi CCMP1516]EOD09602.1 hypothetical protein EMIHUDRAFT_198139 [Emiliania huxleyi CCMP1516]|eukprot:XP_005762031.1 hypothetical protein EMIHUDRAFT_198139 [Emiliania huxleyi CCMP1516]